ncbi:hypothetical protein CK503_15675 [Aliifodinibius salipaludis]|uniref:Erythromycin esterase n=1 Tax=Fodinibius salipaludis TaxID=2032627 RepID=A0A2A2G745_9BACT|nr:erythromycin esterase family protein [Aliifodinibius salipaludis]PAU92647.1 hypothetical protein CK503_15675 [Aliifodinibius salipaludis]
MKRYLLSLFILTFIFSSSSAQQIRNLGFDKASLVNHELPFGWSNKWVNHQINLDSSIAHSGKYSLQSNQSEGKSGGFGISRQSLPAELIRGKDVRVSIQIRSEAVTQGNATARIAVFDKNKNVLNFISIPPNGITGTIKWEKFETKLEVKEEAEYAYLDIFHNGNGKVWFDNIELYIDGKKYNPDSYKPWQASKKEMRWLKKQIIPINTDEGLGKLAPIFEGAKIIGLGENTHGTREFFQFKHQITKWFANKHDTLVFAIEASMAEAKAINQYVLQGKGNPKELLADLHFWTWNTQEVLNLVEWMRSYNHSGKGEITFWGFDMQFPKVSVKEVRDFISNVEPSYLEVIDTSYQALKRPEAMRGMDKHKLNYLHDSASLVLDHLKKSQSKYSKNADSADIALAIQNAIIIKQSVSRFLNHGDSRDKSMAENLQWIKKSNPNASKFIVWAHNNHIGRAPNQMGHYLNKKFGDNYRPIAFGFGEGTYSAVLGPKEPVKSFQAAAPIPGSAEFVFQQLNEPNFSIDLCKAKRDSSGSWLATPKPFRSIGSVAEDLPYKKIPLATYFDALIYFSHSTASHIFGRPEN